MPSDQPMPVQRRFTPVPFTAVSIEGGFWGPRLAVNRERTIPIVYRRLQEAGSIDSFKLDWRPGQEPVPHIFAASDVAKWVQAASHSLAVHPDPALAAQLDEVVDLVLSAQQPDGYLGVYYTVVEPGWRFSDLRDAHELYTAGHWIEAAVAHYQATGDRKLLDGLCRFADLIATVFGRGPGQKRGYPGHPELELALVKLYRATGERRYLELSRYFVDERGRQPHYYDQETEALHRAGRKHFFEDFFRATGYRYDYRYNQSHMPVREQSEIVGHAVRAMYLYSAMADLAGETGDASLLAACERLWESACLRRLYVTGGIGPSRLNEGFTFDYDLPNETAYAETCAAISLAMWSHRQLQFDCDSRYADVMERALYNGILSGVALDGETFFYDNPLASLGNHHRWSWNACPCCATNIIRLLASLGDYLYSQSESDIAVHLYVQGNARLQVGGQAVTLRLETRYPWAGAVTIRLEMERPATFGLRLRIPGWCRSASVRVNGELAGPVDHTERGYVRLERTWQPSDEVNVELAMPVERVYAHPAVRQDVGAVALQRGPVVYCLEQADHAAPVQRMLLPPGAPLTAAFEPDLLGGVGVITGEALAVGDAGWEGALYRAERPQLEPCAIKAIPYFAWDNREAGPMQVWLPEAGFR